MTFKTGTSLMAAVVVVLASVSPSQASHCGAHYAPSHCGNECYYPKLRYKTCYQTVVEERTKTCYKLVPKTIYKECRYIVCKPVWETQYRECRKIVCRKVWVEKKIKVCSGYWKTEKYYVPGRVVCRRVRLPDTCCFDPCTCRTYKCRGGYATCHIQLPGKWRCRKVWCPKTEIRTVKVCKIVPEEVVEKIPVKVCRLVKEEVCKKVPVTVCEKVPYVVKYKVCRRVKVRVPVYECRKPSCFDRLRWRLSSLRHRCARPCHRPACGHGCHGFGLRHRFASLCGRFFHGRKSCCDVSYAPVHAPAHAGKTEVLKVAPKAEGK